MIWKPDFPDASPMFEPLRPAGRGLAQLNHWPELGDLEHLRSKVCATKPIITQSGKPIRFVPQDSSSREFAQQYEPRIYLAGEVQTRPQNWHDLFNALAWLTFPRAKAALNQIHYQAMLPGHREHGKTRSQRGPLRDAATLFDESGVVVASADAGLSELLRNFEWKELFWRRRDAVLARMKFYIFGHALYEKALNPYPGITGKAVILSVEQSFFSQSLPAQLDEIDLMLEQWLSENPAISATPLPVLGYPAWSQDNAAESYFDNREHFRPAPSHIRK